MWFLAPVLSLKPPSFIRYGEKKGQIVSAQQTPTNIDQAKWGRMLNPRMSLHCLQHWCLALSLVHLSRVSSRCLAKRSMSQSGKSSERSFLPHRPMPKLLNDVKWVWMKAFPYWGLHKKSSCYLLILHFVVNTCNIAVTEVNMRHYRKGGYFIWSHTDFTHSDWDCHNHIFTSTKMQLFILFGFLAIT